MVTKASPLPIPVRQALRRLGSDIRDSRLRRRISTTIMAQRAQMSRSTLHNLERGDPAVSMGAYATVLFVLGLMERFTEIAAVRWDARGMSLEEERLPQRIRSKKVVDG
jgi:transcriptional regulator with XRE-family HTH domain